MRVNKYRGFDPITKKFIYGNLLFTNETYYIIPFLTNGCMSQKEMMLRWISPCYQVIPETVGQFTGLHDKNGVEIYEGDIINLIDRHVIVTWNKYLAKYDCEFLRYNGYADNEFIFNGIKLIDLCKFEIIGSIHESEDK